VGGVWLPQLTSLRMAERGRGGGGWIDGGRWLNMNRYGQDVPQQLQVRGRRINTFDSEDRGPCVFKTEEYASSQKRERSSYVEHVGLRFSGRCELRGYREDGGPR